MNLELLKCSIFKEQDTNSIFDHQPGRLLPVISKIFQTVFYEQIGNFAKKILSPKLDGLGKGCSLQKGLFNLTKDGQTIRINLV